MRTAAARTRRINLLYGTLHVDPSNQPYQLPDHLLGQELDGILLIGAFAGDTIDTIAAGRSGPVVLVDGPAAPSPHDTVASDNEGGALLAVRHLIELGHQHIAMVGTDGVWSTTRFVDIDDLRHDMHVNIVNFQPGGVIPFPETHVMEHGLYVLEGKAVYLLNTDWVEVEAGDFMWLRAFCPQACYAGGPGAFRYLLYKDVNRHARLTPD